MGRKEGEKEQICRGEDNNREKASPFTAAMLLVKYAQVILDHVGCAEH